MVSEVIELNNHIHKIQLDAKLDKVEEHNPQHRKIFRNLFRTAPERRKNNLQENKEIIVKMIAKIL